MSCVIIKYAMYMYDHVLWLDKKQSAWLFRSGGCFGCRTYSLRKPRWM